MTNVQSHQSIHSNKVAPFLSLQDRCLKLACTNKARAERIFEFRIPFLIKYRRPGARMRVKKY